MAKELKAKSALHYHAKAFANNWDLNIYRGCGHHCRYCFAQYSHKYLNSNDFFEEIFVKTNIAEPLEKELSKKKWRKDKITVCGVSDCYQPLEKHYKLMPKILRLFKKYRNPMTISTKSTLALRDIDLIKDLAKVADVEIVTSVSTLDESIRKKIEPAAPPAKERIKMLKEFKKVGCKIFVLLMPIIPHLTDGDDNLEEIFKLMKKCGVEEVIAGTLHLRGNTKKEFFKFIKEEIPELEEKLRKLYVGAYASKEYRKNLGLKIKKLRIKYNLHKSYEPKTKKIVQLTLFDIK